MAKKKDEEAPKKSKSGAAPKDDRQAKQPKAPKGEPKAEKGAAKSTNKPEVRLESRLYKHYLEVVTPRLTQQFGWTNRHQVPRIEKVKMNCGLGEASKNQKLLDSVVEEFRLITGQK